MKWFVPAPNLSDRRGLIATLLSNAVAVHRLYCRRRCHIRCDYGLQKLLLPCHDLAAVCDRRPLLRLASDCGDGAHTCATWESLKAS